MVLMWKRIKTLSVAKKKILYMYSGKYMNIGYGLDFKNMPINQITGKYLKTQLILYTFL